ncbi:MAG: multicopper oxidase domain-containing protein [Solirubrobacterales bacterium]
MASRKLTRRGLIGAGAAAAPAIAALHEAVPHRGLHQALGGDQHASAAASPHAGHGAGKGLGSHDGFGAGAVDHEANGFDPSEIVRDFDYGTTSRMADGRTLREWTVVAEDKDIEIAPGIIYPAWTYNGRIPGPTFRATEGDRMRIRFINGSQHPHTIHFHGFHPDFMDGMPGVGEGRGGGLIATGEQFVYEFDAEPFGLHLYHCHATPLSAHIAKGLYGAMVIDPREPRERADELLMVMNGFDTNFDGANELYGVNTIPFHYVNEPVKVKRKELVRIYLANLLEFDQINSFHVHANFFDYYPTGTRREPTEFTDTIIQGQGQRGILELRFPYTGKFMFHAHKTEFAELGWLGFFEVED